MIKFLIRIAANWHQNNLAAKLPQHFIGAYFGGKILSKSMFLSHGQLSASFAVIRLSGSRVNILSSRSSAGFGNLKCKGEMLSTLFRIKWANRLVVGLFFCTWMHEKVLNLRISFPRNVAFAILRGNVSFRCIFLSFSFKKFSHFFNTNFDHIPGKCCIFCSLAFLGGRRTVLSCLCAYEICFRYWDVIINLDKNREHESFKKKIF